MKCLFALLLVTFGNAILDSSTEFESDEGLARDAIEKREAEEADEEVSSLADVDEEANDECEFLECTPRQLLKFAETTCGRAWPTSCAAENSAQTGATDGFLCDPNRPATKNIAEPTVYKLPYKFQDAGPTEEVGFQRHSRCRKGKCKSTMKNLKKTNILKISEIGAKLCLFGVKETVKVEIEVEIDGTTQKQEVDVDIIPSKTSHLEDISVKLSIPIAAVTFETAGQNGADGKSFLNADIATKAIKDALNAVGALSSATTGKVCAHGFTDGSQVNIDAQNAFFKDLVEGRAAKVAQVAMAHAGNKNINTYEGVSHLVHVDTPSAGLIIKLNGAAAEACAAGDWIGAPLS